MTRILHQLPILQTQTSVQFANKHVTILPDQILIWVSISLKGVRELEQNTPYFPALLDTGNNFDFTASRHHLTDWAGMQPELLPVLGDLQIEKQKVPRHAGNVWLHPNIPGKRELWSGKRACPLELDRGIAVYPVTASPAGPRLPLLGLAAVLRNHLDLWIDPVQRQVCLRTVGWRTRFFRLLS